jgi:tRNA threonylcarbamoyladenosine modification (KEOPS) complex  Pcc1 subunit
MIKMNYKIYTELVFQYENIQESEMIERVLKPEGIEDVGPRSKVNIDRIENMIIIKISAKDLTVLRSIINTYIRWITIIEKIKKLVGGKIF